MKKLIIILIGFLFVINVNAQDQKKQYNTLYTHTDVDEMALCPWSEADLLIHIQNSVDLNMNMRDKFSGNYNTIVLSFKVEVSGNISEVSIVESTTDDTQMERQLIKIVESMPGWKPAKKDNEEISSTMYLPIRFTIKDDMLFIENRGQELVVVKNDIKTLSIKIGLVAIAIAFLGVKWGNSNW